MFCSYMIPHFTIIYENHQKSSNILYAFVYKNRYIQNLSTSEGWIILTPSELAIKQKIIKANNEIIIENYKDGNVVATYKYDNSGKAIAPMENINQLPANFIENTFRKLIPYN